MKTLTDEEQLNLEIYIEQIIHREIEKMVKQEAKEISQKIESKVNLETNINTLINKIISKKHIKGYIDNISNTLEHFLNDLDDINLFRENIRNEIIASIAEEKENLIETVNNEIESLVENQKEVISEYAHEAYELSNYIENAKKRIINEIVSEATKRIEIEDVRPRTIEIYQNNSLEKTLDKELYHQDFEKIYKLIKIGLPVMLIGPTGSGKLVLG